ncbi:hypothetical protein CBM2631_B10252 [Cupriavidus taiwanensis]|nr:hypothetical protein CBM2588_B20119 [Cupriavidus taiwanensis]SOY92339.1 hypothetical protein CBM2591_B10412 [Cupriavidus taiwanensis]SOZ74105.1 hypothetical protein CBM2617_B30094 [Cupriavidus taiwanensis]SOZ88012.1 hypothetical protein CBM2618_B30093 [Cupriavidus taiwanensis]SOZ90874.1 hypothetical protein CBM2622_B30093 [Cupriavidus taiwanensis]
MASLSRKRERGARQRHACVISD